MTTINLRPEASSRRTHGVLLTSETRHRVTGDGVHNRSHDHQVDVWQNALTFADGRERCYVDPSGNETARTYSFLLSARPTMIARHRLGDEVETGDPLETGGLVRLAIAGFGIGWFQIMAQPLRDPILVPVDISTSASRQFYIDSGEYLERDLND